MQSLLTKLTLFSFILLFTQCIDEPKTTVKFCESFDKNDQCVNIKNEFKPYTRVYIRCESTKPFNTDKITGSIYNVFGESKNFIGAKEFKVKPEDKTIAYYIPFEQYGGLGDFLIEFKDEKGKLIAEGKMTVKP